MQMKNNSIFGTIKSLNTQIYGGGERGIRTLDRVSYTRVRGVL